MKNIMSNKNFIFLIFATLATLCLQSLAFLPPDIDQREDEYLEYQQKVKQAYAERQIENAKLTHEQNILHRKEMQVPPWRREELRKTEAEGRDYFASTPENKRNARKQILAEENRNSARPIISILSLLLLGGIVLTVKKLTPEADSHF